MNQSPGHASVPIWQTDADQNLNTELINDSHCDVCVIGAGVGGLTTAYLLQKAGKKVCVVDAFGVASGQTGRSTAQFSTSLDDRYFDLEKYHGSDGARLAAESHQAAIELALNIIKDEKIDCDSQIVDGYLFRAPESEADILNREFESCQRLGMKDVRLETPPKDDPMLTGHSQALVFPRQLQVDPFLYTVGLAKAFKKLGGTIFTNLPVTSVKGGSGATVTTKSGNKISCESIVVATNSPINDIFAIHTKQAPYRTYVIGVQISKGSVPMRLYWDTMDPYHYVRMSGEDVLLVGGEDHKTGQDDSPEECYERLEKWIRQRIPQAQQVVSRWSGQVMEPTDGLGFLGHNPLDRNNVYVITGDSGNGMTHGTIGGILINDQIHGRTNPWEKLYSPSRKSFRAGFEFVRENANVAAQYLDWLTPKTAKSLEQIAPGTGALIREGAMITAVHKSESGIVTKCSAVCPHLGGIVHWNPAENSWDCPCHGSRFNSAGKVIEGPATTDLAQI